MVFSANTRFLVGVPVHGMQKVIGSSPLSSTKQKAVTHNELRLFCWDHKNGKKCDLAPF
jgi:hypothetical protein